jgi:hypothetical protein
LKTSNDLEVYELDEASKDKMEEICDLRQPVIFDFENENIIKYSNRTYILNNYHAFEMKVRNNKEMDKNNELYIPLPLHTTIKLFDEDKSNTYFSENNQEFLQETGVIKSFVYNDYFLRPYMMSNSNYDILLGSENTVTPFRYLLNFRNYFIVTEGEIEIKLASPNNYKYLHVIKDYENFEFSSVINPWNVDPKYQIDFSKIKCLDIKLKVGQTFYLPAYWFYSIKFSKNSSISSFKYRTYINNLAILPHIGMYILQMQNIKRNIIKKKEDLGDECVDENKKINKLEEDK